MALPAAMPIRRLQRGCDRTYSASIQDATFNFSCERRVYPCTVTVLIRQKYKLKIRFGDGGRDDERFPFRVIAHTIEEEKYIFFKLSRR